MMAVAALVVTASIVFAIIHVAAAAVCAVAHNYWLNERMATESLDPLLVKQNVCIATG